MPEEAPTPTVAASPAAVDAPPRSVTPSRADQPISLWPEGVVAGIALITIGLVAYQHRRYLRRKYLEAKRLLDEFQKHGGLEELQVLARRAGDLFDRD